jgi:hypothetical protein
MNNILVEELKLLAEDNAKNLIESIKNVTLFEYKASNMQLQIEFECEKTGHVWGEMKERRQLYMKEPYLRTKICACCGKVEKVEFNNNGELR